MPTIVKGRFVYILMREGQIIGTWSNLKHLCDDMNKTENFISYSKLSKETAEHRRNGDNTPLLSFTTKDEKAFSIQVNTLK